jgi:hypothetical protein
MYFKEAGGRIGSFRGYLAAIIPTIEMSNNFIIAAEELRMIEAIIDPEPISPSKAAVLNEAILHVPRKSSAIESKLASFCKLS